MAVADPTAVVDPSAPPASPAKAAPKLPMAGATDVNGTTPNATGTLPMATAATPPSYVTPGTVNPTTTGPGSYGYQPAFSTSTDDKGNPVAWNTITGADGRVSAQNGAASDDWWATHNSDGSPRQADTQAAYRADQANVYATQGVPGIGNENVTPPGGGLTAAQQAANPLAPSIPPIASPTGGATDQGGSLPIGGPALAAAPTASLPLAQAPQTATSGSGGVSLPLASSQTSTGNSGVGLTPSDSATGNYLNQTIQPDQSVDRVKLGQDIFNTFQKSTDPAYQASILDAERNGAALGQIGSGGLRTSVGNLANQRGLQLDTARDTAAQNALTGSIGDMYNNIGIAQQQQGFQAGQQNTDRSFNDAEQNQAFGQGATQAQLQDQLQNSDFARYLQLLNAGQTGNPSDTALALSNNYGQQASQAGQAAGNLIGSSVANQNSGIPAWLQQYLASLSGGSTIPKPTSTGVDTLPMSGTYG